MATRTSVLPEVELKFFRFHSNLFRASLNEPKSPIVVFIARDHHYDRADFTRLQEEEEIRVRVIGQRFEIGDEAISVIGELV